jgi:hypothetical protein
LNSFVCGAESPVAVCALPKRQGDRNGIDVDPIPPCRFITMPVKFAMVKSTNRYRELITDFAAQRTRLCEAKMVRIGGFAAAHQARLLGHEFAMVLSRRRIVLPTGKAPRLLISSVAAAVNPRPSEFG